MAGSSITNIVDMEHTLIVMAVSMPVNGKMERNMDKVHINGSTVQSILENGLMIRWMVKAPLSGQITECISVLG